jgi:hypothetical protein
MKTIIFPILLSSCFFGTTENKISHRHMLYPRDRVAALNSNGTLLWAFDNLDATTGKPDRRLKLFLTNQDKLLGSIAFGAGDQVHVGPHPDPARMYYIHNKDLIEVGADLQQLAVYDLDVAGAAPAADIFICDMDVSAAGVLYVTTVEKGQGHLRIFDGPLGDRRIEPIPQSFKCNAVSVDDWFSGSEVVQLGEINTGKLVRYIDGVLSPWTILQGLQIVDIAAAGGRTVIVEAKRILLANPAKGVLEDQFDVYQGRAADLAPGTVDLWFTGQMKQPIASDYRAYRVPLK